MVDHEIPYSRSQILTMFCWMAPWFLTTLVHGRPWLIMVGYSEFHHCSCKPFLYYHHKIWLHHGIQGSQQYIFLLKKQVVIGQVKWYLLSGNRWDGGWEMNAVGGWWIQCSLTTIIILSPSSIIFPSSLSLLPTLSWSNLKHETAIL